MSGWERETLYCTNHPDRIALERCEVCQKPLCAYCLYYTEDGQRLCNEHAEEARVRGMRVEEPGVYAAQLIGAQVGAARKDKRGQTANDEDLIKGNSNDLMAFLGMLAGATSLTICCGGMYCLPFVGVILSLLALFNTKKSHDPKRTRRFGVIGLLLSGVWVLALAGCVAVYVLSLSSAFDLFNNTPVYYYYGTGTPQTATTTPIPTWTLTPTAEEQEADSSVWLVETPTLERNGTQINADEAD